MGLEQRGNVQAYYRKVRRGRQVFSQYEGSGLFAELAATLAEAKRQERDALRAAARAQQVEEAALQALVDEPFTLALQLAMLALRIAGYHQHKGQWRRRRASQEKTRMGKKSSMPASEAPIVLSNPPTAAEVRAVLERADRPMATPQDRAALRELYDRAPGLWQLQGDIGRRNVERLIERGFRGSHSGQEAMKRRAQALAEELAGPAPQPLERMLVDTVVLCWARLQLAELVYTSSSTQEGGARQAELDALTTLLDGAQRRYLRAVEALARVRRLALPVLIQNNAAVQQVNIAGQA